jgi:serine/threonine protein kinase
MASPQVIGEGTYGCVIKPSLKCDDKQITYKNKISKLMLSTDAKKEVEEYVLIGKADPKTEFYTGSPLRCTVKETEIAKVYQKCKMIRKNSKNKTVKQLSHETSLLVIGDGGDDLEKWVKNKKLSKVDWGNLWKEIPRLFRGLQVFKKNDIVHHDLKPQNVVYRMEDHRLNFIDFGLMRSIKTEAAKCKDVNSCQANPHWNYPTDILFMNKRTYGIVAHQTPQQRLKTFDEFMNMFTEKKDTPFVNAFRIMYDYCLPKSGTRRKQFFENYWMGFKDLILQIQPKEYNGFLEKALDGFDVFGFGLTLLFTVTRSEKMMHPGFVSRMDDLCLKMMTPNLYVRLSVEQAASEYDTIIAELR